MKKVSNDVQFLSAADLAARWSVSRTGAVGICMRATIPSYFLGAVKRGARRFRLSDIEIYEAKTKA